MKPIRNLYPGSNTSLGFVSLYDNILPFPLAKRVIVLKGGPGVGKSTLMRNIGQKFHALGHEVELMHCSGDNGSLDGVVLPKSGIAVLDGTAPHIVDPKWPGSVDGIFNLGIYLDEAALAKNRKAISGLFDEIAASYARAYRYLGAAGLMWSDIASQRQSALDPTKLHALCAQLLSKIFPDTTFAVPGTMRKLFATAYTPGGFVSFVDDIVRDYEVWDLSGGPGSGSAWLLSRIAQTAKDIGLNTEAFYCPMAPDTLELLTIPDKKIAFTAVPLSTLSPSLKVDLLQCQSFTPRASLMAQSQEALQDLTACATLSMARAKTLHDELETYYTAAMDFAGSDIAKQKLISDIEQMI